MEPQRFTLRPPRVKDKEAARALRQPGARCTLLALKARQPAVLDGQQAAACQPLANSSPCPPCMGSMLLTRLDACPPACPAPFSQGGPQGAMAVLRWTNPSAHADAGSGGGNGRGRPRSAVAPTVWDPTGLEEVIVEDLPNHRPGLAASSGEPEDGDEEDT